MTQRFPAPQGDPIGRDSAGVTIEHVELGYGATRVLKDVNLDIRPGEFFAFLGPSGCGKTTLLRLIAGFAQAQRGRVLVGGEDVSALPPWKRDVGMVFQSYALWPHMTVRQNVAFGLEERKVARAQIGPRVEAALALVGLRELADRRPSQLSGGQQQRVALARTIVVEPRVLLLDEPLSNLDAKLRVEVRRELRDLQQRLRLTTIFVTHDQEEANAICDRIAVMNDGVVQQVGAPMELYEKPANLFVAGFLGTANILDGEVVRDGSATAFRLSDGALIALPENGPAAAGAKLMFRPQHATLIPADEDAPGALAGAVTHREFLGAQIRYALRIGGRDVVVDAPFRAAADLIEPGAVARIALAPERVRLLGA